MFPGGTKFCFRLGALMSLRRAMSIADATRNANICGCSYHDYGQERNRQCNEFRRNSITTTKGRIAMNIQSGAR